MKLLLNRLQNNDLYFLFVFIIFSFLPILLKLLFTGSTGPTIEFYLIAVWLPLVSLVFSLIRGWKNFIFTLFVLIVSFSIIILNYSSAPPMNFQRQFVYEADLLIICAVGLSLLFQVVYSRYQLRANSINL